MIRVACPRANCGKTYRVAPSALGRQVTCTDCGCEFIAAPESVETIIDAAPDIVSALEPAKQPPAVPQMPAASSSRTSRGPQRDATGSPPRIGRFEIRAKLGHGAFGTVYRAYDPQLDREVAIKVPQLGLLNSPQMVERFLREAKAAARLNHPHIVPVYDAGCDGDRHYIATAFISGRPLSELIENYSDDFWRIAELVRKLATALEYAHSQGIVHRDVKPHNILIDSDGEPHLLDFGLAQMGDVAQKLTHDGAVMGTPAYMSPEQAGGDSHSVTAASDQYSLGVVLYELLTGETPFSGPPAVVLFNVLHRAADPPRSRNPRVPRDLETICLKALSRDADGRYASAARLGTDLARWAEDLPIQARPISWHEHVVRWYRRHPHTATLSAAVVVVTLLGLVTTTAALIRAEHARKEASTNLGIAQEEARRAEQNLQQARRQEAEAARQSALAQTSQRDAKQQAEIAQLESARAQQQTLLANEKSAAEAEQRELAERNASESERQRMKAETAANAALQSSISAASRAYLADMRLVQQMWEDGDLGEFRRLMAKYQSAQLPDGTDPRGFEFNYWQRMEGACALSLKANRGITDLQTLGDRTKLVAVGDSGQLILWDVTTGVQSFQKTDLPVGHLSVCDWRLSAVAPKVSLEPQARLVVGCSDGSLRIFDQLNWERPPFRWNIGATGITQVFPILFDPTLVGKPLPLPLNRRGNMQPRVFATVADAVHLVGIGYEKSYGVVMPVAERSSKTFKPELSGVSPTSALSGRIDAAATFFPSRGMTYTTDQYPAWTAVASATGEVLVWGDISPTQILTNGKYIREHRFLSLVGAAQPVRQLQFSVDGNALIAIDADQTVKIWRLDQAVASQASAILPQTLSEIRGALTGLITSDFLFAVGHVDGTVGIYKLPDTTPLEIRKLHTKPVTHMCLGANGTIVAASAEDGQIFAWRPLAEVQPVDLPVPRGSMSLAGLLADSQAGVWIARENVLEYHDFSSKTIKTTTPFECEFPILELLASPADDTVVCRTQNDEVCIVHREQGLVRRWQGVRTALTDQDELHLLTAERGWLRWKDGRERESNGRAPHPEGYLQCLSAGASPLVIEGGPREWSLWSADDKDWVKAWSQKLTPSTTAKEVATIAVRPGVAAERRYWREYWLGEVPDAAKLKHKASEFRPAAYSAKLKQLALGGYDDKIRVYDPSTGKSAPALSGHTALVSAMAYMHDGRRLITGDIDGTLILWDAAAGEPLLWLQAPGTHTGWISVSADDKTIAAGGLGWTRIWTATPVAQPAPAALK